MVKHAEKILVLSVLAIILLSSTCMTIVPAVSAAEKNPETETLTILSDVVGLKMEKYTTTQSNHRDSKYLDQPQKEADLCLSSPEGSFRVTCSYIKDTLKLLYFSDIKEQPSLKQRAANTIDMSKSLMERYQSYSGNSLYGKFALMLDDANVNTNITKVAGNVKLQVSGSESNIISYTWTFIDENGVVAEKKNVGLTYELGALKTFSNNWPLYTIADTELRVTAKDATKLAVEASKTYSYVIIDENGEEKSVSGFSIAPESLAYAKLIYLSICVFMLVCVYHP